jgi:fermentation-respiration switch protein FrsA (DUF1100 family)
MTDRPVNFYSGPGLKLEGVLRTPARRTKNVKAPCIIFCAGPGTGRTPSLSDYHHAPRFTERFVAGGYAALRFHYRGVGLSEGPEHRLIGMEMVEDIRNAITFAQQQPEVDPTRIGLWGATTGASNVCYVAGVDDRVRCTVAVSAPGDCGRWQRGNRPYWQWVELLNQLEEDRRKRVITGKSGTVNVQVLTAHGPAHESFAAKLKELYPEYQLSERLITLESIASLLAFRAEAEVCHISPRAIQWIVAGNDTLVPVAESQGMYDLAREPKKLVVIPDKAHEDLYFDDGFEQVVRHTMEWFGQHL